jgi:transglutaminase-like putative cysteine protease
VTPQRCPVPPGAAMSNPDALLRPDARVPVGGEPARVLLAQRTVPADATSAARLLYDVIDDHLQYRKDRPGWGNGDAEWACHSGFGNCTDFHSLFISLARTERLPAVFQIDLDLVPKQAGPPLNFFVYPYVEEDGRPVPQERIAKSFSYRAVP